MENSGEYLLITLHSFYHQSTQLLKWWKNTEQFTLSVSSIIRTQLLQLALGYRVTLLCQGPLEKLNFLFRLNSKQSRQGHQCSPITKTLTRIFFSVLLAWPYICQSVLSGESNSFSSLSTEDQTYCACLHHFHYPSQKAVFFQRCSRSSKTKIPSF